jgi:hypothetical protein
LDGELTIRQGDSGANLTYGELSVLEGTYSAYNTELTLEHGKLLFFGAYDNPALDVRAVRRVEELTAGLQINGTLKNINSQLYSSPSLPDNDIIAVLITGKPFAQIGHQDGAMLLGAVAGLGLERGEGLTNQIRDKLGLDALSVDSTGDLNNSTLTDRPWSQYFCCLSAVRTEYMRKHPVATKRALRAFYKAAEICVNEPERAAQIMVKAGVSDKYEYVLQSVREIGYRNWRLYDSEDTMRFWALRLREAGIISVSPKKVLAEHCDWRFSNELKRELKA